MIKILDMKFMRYMNLFSRITRVRAKHCFSYNNMILFVVPARFVAESIGKDNANLKKLSQILEKRIRIVAEPRGQEKKDIDYFVSVVVSPVKYNSLDVIDSEVIITADREGKARLIGRERVREAELKDILSQYFGIKSIKIV